MPYPLFQSSPKRCNLYPPLGLSSAQIILGMYVGTAWWMMPVRETGHYNATMATMAANWTRVRGWPPLVFDAVLAIALTFVIFTGADKQASPLLLLITLPLIWRRTQPMLVFALVVLGALGSNPPPAVFGPIMISAYSMGAYSRYRALSLGVLLATATVVLATVGGQLPSLPDFAGPYVVVLPLWLIGNALRSRQDRIEALQERAILFEREQVAATKIALAEDRARVARELHDVVAHSVSVMVVQAGAARQVLPTNSEGSREALLAVEATGRETMTELRNLLGVLHAEGSDLALTPQPGVEQLDTLVQRVGDAGLPVQFRVEGEPRPLPVGIDLAAYRIVQEALTNALKHSGLARTQVILDYREDELKVEILDDGSQQVVTGDMTGRGLAGMQERVELYGGTLEVGPRLERGYAVRAWLPLAVIAQ
jgi:signal transduction histidine kinase